MEYKYIDVSRYQDKIDWQAVKNAGIQGAILKTVSTNASFGGLYIDPFFEYNYQECKRLGIPVGVYYYTYALDRGYADKELELLKKALQGKSFELPIAIDVEDNSISKLDKQGLTGLVKYALDVIQSWGCYAMLYTYTNFKNNYLDMALLANYDLWIADYTGKTPTVPHGIHQYTSKGNVAGISGYVDMNNAYKDYPSIIVGRYNNFTGAEIAPQPEIKPISTKPVRLVIGFATQGDLKKIKDCLAEKVIGYNEENGILTTNKEVSAGDQIGIIKLCKELVVPVDEYVEVPEPPKENWLIKFIDLLFGWLFK